MRPDRSIDAAAEVLADTAHVHWPLAQLVTFAAEGIRELAAVLPHEFSDIVDVPLAPQTDQVVPTGYTDIVEIIGERDLTTGEIALYDTERELTDASKLINGRYQCLGQGPYAPKLRYRVVESARGRFVVHPVPTGPVTVAAVLIAEPPAYTVSDYNSTVAIPRPSDAMEPILTHWIVARAYEVDAESDVANDRAAYFRTRFYTEVNAAYSAASRMRSGYVLGQVGIPDGHVSPARFNERRVFG